MPPTLPHCQQIVQEDITLNIVHREALYALTYIHLMSSFLCDGLFCDITKYAKLSYGKDLFTTKLL